MIVYDKLFDLLEQKGLKKIDLRKRGIHAAVVDKLVKNKTVDTTTINNLCAVLGCQPGDIMAYVIEEGWQSVDLKTGELSPTDFSLDEE